MKKILAALTAVLCLLIFSTQTALAASSLAGTTWELTGAIVAGAEQAASGMTIDFGTNGRYAVATANESEEGTYNQSGDTVIFDAGTDNEFQGLIRDNRLLLDMDDVVLVLQQSSGSQSGDDQQQPDNQQPSGGGQQPSGEQQPGGGDGQQQPGGEGQPKGGIQGIIDYLTKNKWMALGIIAGAVIGMMIRKNRQPASTAVPPAYSSAASAPIPAAMPAQQPSAGGAASYLICNRGHFAGTTFPINGSLSVGRDPKRCQLVFPNDTKGISSLHCEVRQQAYGVTLTDMGSTYGTFLTGGRKLNQGESVTLNSGDSFYLADTSNEFKIL